MRKQQTHARTHKLTRRHFKYSRCTCEWNKSKLHQQKQQQQRRRQYNKIYHHRSHMTATATTIHTFSLHLPHHCQHTGTKRTANFVARASVFLSVWDHYQCEWITCCSPSFFLSLFARVCFDSSIHPSIYPIPRNLRKTNCNKNTRTHNLKMDDAVQLWWNAWTRGQRKKYNDNNDNSSSINANTDSVRKAKKLKKKIELNGERESMSKRVNKAHAIVVHRVCMCECAKSS